MCVALCILVHVAPGRLRLARLRSAAPRGGSDLVRFGSTFAHAARSTAPPPRRGVLPVGSAPRNKARPCATCGKTNQSRPHTAYFTPPRQSG